LKRFILIGTAVAALVCAGVAYATLNTYTATLTFKGSAGTAAKPAPFGFTENLSAANATSGYRAAPLINITTTIGNAVANYKPFKTCTSKVIDAPPKYNAACPKGSEIGSGAVTALLGGPDLGTAGTACAPDLAVYNGGGGKIWFFFTVPSATACGGLTTGATPPYPGTLKKSGKNLVIDVPLPPFVSTMVANHTGLYGSLIKELLTFPATTTKSKGKKVSFLASTGCKGKRSYSVSYTATDSTGTTETDVVSGSAKC
jgi:hypothetical protein